ncbi:hypothetical protein K1719_024618 [Acacia pycnantha]|nr:hypothetical protein K1719_024618 [Acacia pycnantha]
MRGKPFSEHEIPEQQVRVQGTTETTIHKKRIATSHLALLSQVLWRKPTASPKVDPNQLPQQGSFGRQSLQDFCP